MIILLAALTALHVLTGVFWAGTTFAMARTQAAKAEWLARPQIWAATIAILAGAGLWHLLHGHRMEGPEMVLAAGAIAALAAAGVQSSALRSVRRLSDADASIAEASRRRVIVAQRIAAVLLALTIVAMASFRYA